MLTLANEVDPRYVQDNPFRLEHFLCNAYSSWIFAQTEKEKHTRNKMERKKNGSVQCIKYAKNEAKEPYFSWTK